MHKLNNILLDNNIIKTPLDSKDAKQLLSEIFSAYNVPYTILRNISIREEYAALHKTLTGSDTFERLSDKYNLSYKAIESIIYNYRKNKK
jgi:hypothetical protein